MRTGAALAILAVVLFFGRLGIFGVLPLLLVVLGPRRHPRLTVAVEGADANGVVWAPPARWPVSAERVIANERASLTGHLDVFERASQTSLMAAAFGTVPANDRAFQEARSAFMADVNDYEERLRRWLSDYDTASAAEETTLSLRFSVANGSNWSTHAEKVRLEILLPASATRARHVPSISLPPESPEYEPPARQQVFPGALAAASADTSRFPAQNVEPLLGPDSFRELFASPVEPARSAWTSPKGGMEILADVGDVYVGDSEQISEPVIVQLSEPTVTLTWRLLFRDGTREGTVTLRQPERPRSPGPAFGRLAGVLAYPDVAIVDEDDAIVHTKRQTNPPLTAPVGHHDPSENLLDRMRDVAAFNEWSQLGLDPAGDGEGTVIRVGEARRV